MGGWLPFGQQFRFESGMTRQEARKAARTKKDKAPSNIDEIWGFAFGSLIFLQAGLVGSPPALFAWVRQRQQGIEVSGFAGLNLAGIIPFSLLLAGLFALGAVLLSVRGNWQLLAGSGAGLLLLYAVAWSNHIFRKDADHLVHLLRRALGAKELEKEDRAHEQRSVAAATLVIDGEEEHEGPSPYDVREAVLGLANYHFLIISFADEDYMQVLKEDGGYRLERREGSADQHFRACGDITPQGLVAILEHYLLNRRAPADVAWERVEL